MSSDERDSFKVLWDDFMKSIKGIDIGLDFSRRPLSEEDLLGWSTAQDMRDAVKPRSREEVRRAMLKINPIRWWQMQRDFKWLQKQMKRMGMNPEDARYIL